TGVVALEFRNPDDTFFVHGAVIDAYEDGRSPDVMYFVVHNAQLNDEWFFQSPGQLFDTRAFKRRLEHYALPRRAKAEVFARVEDYRLHLLNRLGQLRETFPSRIVKGLAFTPLVDIRHFVMEYLLDENLVDVKTLQAQLETLRHFEALAADIRERIATLNQIGEIDQERLANRRRRITNGYVQRRAQADTHLTDLKARRLELDEARLELSRAHLQRDELAEQIKRAQTALVDAQVALQTDTTAIRERELREKIASLDAELKQLRDSESRLTAALIRETADAKKLCEFLSADGLAMPPALNEFIADPQSQITHYQAAIESLGQEYARQDALLSECVRALREEGQQLEQEIRQLKTGDREASYETEAPEAARLRRLLRAELGLAADEVIFLCTALQVPDESWQDAVEGVLGHNRFTLLVPPKRYSAAMKLYRERRHTDNLHGVGLLDAERILAEISRRPSIKNSLAAEVETSHPAARAFVDLVLGGYAKCDSLEALRDHRTAVTRECFVRRNFTTAHLNPRIYHRWFIGERAAPRQIEQREARLKEIGGEMAGLAAQTAVLKERFALTRDKARPLLELEHALPALARLPEVTHQLRSLRGEMRKLDRASVEALQTEADRCQKELDVSQNQARELDQQVGRLEARSKVLETETVPQLERSVESGNQSAAQFLEAERADSALVEEIEKEYTRRRERQPLETVLANATRYAGDYQTAEAKSRDRLREAKQSYSLKYDFGYDNDEDAARYTAEREKFEKSELPQYETQIAAQRALAEQELVENFIHRLREQIDDARQQLDYLNATLKDLRFGGERFEFITKAAPTLKQVYDMIMDSQQILGDSLFESDFRQKHQPGWDLLFERLTRTDDETTGELRELQDYRNYLEYDIRVHYPNGDRALLSQINAKKSGGETTTPFYVAMAASFAQAYRLNQPRPSDTIRLALFDEAFSKMDTARTASALQFMRDTGLQVLLATPPDKSGALLQHVDCVRTVVRKNGHSFVIEIDKAEMLRELEGIR
ncbi:MAG TPA: SbcC/MukB-like Walker B domain-containing protein, partial [Anaerolineales bacterium]|nr:SbcC/MukB-like Walker B domain-containing protein [Anaerolineales bacterium]